MEPSSNDTNQAKKSSRSAVFLRKMTVEEEKKTLKRRLAEIEEDEVESLQTMLKEKKLKLEKIKSDNRKQREAYWAEFVNKTKVLQTNEERKCGELKKEIDEITSEIDDKKRGYEPEKNKDIESSLKCPVCLDVCKPPLQIWQCLRGHIICGSCVARPELRICPLCRISLTGQLSRNRALEDIARKTFPRETKQENRVGETKELLNLKVDWEGKLIEYKIRFTTRMEVLMNDFCKRKGLQANSVRILLDGIRIDPEDTPESLGARDGDVIDVFRAQWGSV
eukprot:GFUD01018828.1.p1 GENE.GFUD01018828.1~~GFUD01018828.1.p1  ORF type:complete len:280 (+),score=92.96 GFUD01018828.1:391-1230(+)